MKKDFRGLLVGEAWPEGLEQERLHPDGLLPVREGDAAVLVEVHLAKGHLNEILHTLILVLFQTLSDNVRRPRAVKQVEHLLAADEAIAVEIINVKTVLEWWENL